MIDYTGHRPLDALSDLTRLRNLFPRQDFNDIKVVTHALNHFKCGGQLCGIVNYEKSSPLSFFLS